MEAKENTPKSLKQFAQKHFYTLLYQKANTRAIFTVLGLTIKEFRVSFKQFFSWPSPIASFLRSLKYAMLALLRIPFGRSMRISYSFTGEDRIIDALLKPLITYNGFYVDAGCNDPRFLSNTFLFYKKGWKGICIDANEKLIKKFQEIRPRDKAVCALLSNEKKSMEFIELINNTLSSTDTAYLSQMIEEGQTVVNRKIMAAQTLTEILDQNNAPAYFDLLSVDVEEHDFSVLQSLDFQKYHPRLIVVEAEDFDIINPGKHLIYSFLEGKGYSLKGYILTNLYFMKEWE
jgi:FkbM family methyltransferase